MANPVVYVDVDDTLVRSAGTKRIPMPTAIERVRSLHREGAVLYLWSAAGAAYAESTAKELAIDACFAGFLPKPAIFIDDQAVAEWRGLVHEYPLGASLQPPSDVDIQPGDLYEDCGYHPCLCVDVIYGEVRGISLVDGSYPRSCDLRLCGVRKLSVEEASRIKQQGPDDAEARDQIAVAQRWWRT